ncbi:hypothetical protein EGJ51_16685 [Pseudomonas fulva]|nr:hypothetical protein DMX01_18515 [Pseudomonas fulva]PYC10874.1 hypothetical protein DMX00_19285 [Pseudomonas fulva]RRW59992.1 hypothetical protein EGJ51_16685 [Pseudomonas fulva]HCP29699.1 hypothetical protein [Pseudomonas sp.]
MTVRKSLTVRSEKTEKRYTLQIFICVQSMASPVHCVPLSNRAGHGSAYQSCVAVTQGVSDTDADFDQQEHKTVEPENEHCNQFDCL